MILIMSYRKPSLTQIPPNRLKKQYSAVKKAVSIHLVVYFNDTPENPTVTRKHLRKILDSKLSY